MTVARDMGAAPKSSRPEGRDVLSIGPRCFIIGKLAQSDESSSADRTERWHESLEQTLKLIVAVTGGYEAMCRVLSCSK
jgi:hypothetical protein